MKRAWRLLLALALLPALCLPALGEGDVIVACVGDSLTYGLAPDAAGLQAEHPYPAVLDALLGEGFDVRNYGVSGASLTEYGYCYRDLNAFALSLEARPDLVIVMLGTNDCSPMIDWDAARFEADLSGLVDAYRAANARAAVCLMAPPACFPDAVYGQRAVVDARLRGELRDIVARVARAKGALYIDVYDATENHPEWYGWDGLHLSDEGYIHLASVVYGGIRDAAEALR